MKNLSKEFWRIFGKVNIFERQFYGGIKPD